MFSRLMVPLDGSAHSECALPVAARIARSCGSHLLLIHVVPPLTRAVPSWEPEFRSLAPHELAGAYLARVRRQSELAGIPIETAVYGGVVDDVIVEVVREREVELVVMLSHARRRRGRWLLGSVANGVIHRSPAPVLLLRRPLQHKMSSRWSKIPPRVTFDLLIALDGSALAEAALDSALELAIALTCSKPIRVLLVHVVQANPLGVWGQNPEPQEKTAIALLPDSLVVDSSFATADRYLSSVADRVNARLACGVREPGAVQVSRRVLQETEVAPAIVLLAERGPDLRHPFDLVALSAHGAGGWERWILGGVTERVLWGTPLPVLVVRPASLTRS